VQNFRNTNHVRGSTEETHRDNRRGGDLWDDAIVDALCFVNGIFVMARSVGVRKDQLTSPVERCKSRTKCTKNSQLRSRIRAQVQNAEARQLS
jgi:hypothetical protein